MLTFTEPQIGVILRYGAKTLDDLGGAIKEAAHAFDAMAQYVSGWKHRPPTENEAQHLNGIALEVYCAGVTTEEVKYHAFAYYIGGKWMEQFTGQEIVDKVIAWRPPEDPGSNTEEA